ncbi:MAG: YggS family pyridoxal phosphate-dependent enzyme [Flavobacteriales bacterium]|nr:YggS family pyridoxal phosphate-dependent enzyme [Flavobacteriales bacterium]
MTDIRDNIFNIKQIIPKKVTLVAVTKKKPISDIKLLYNYGHKVFGENKIQELIPKYESLPKDIEWHMIGHLQRNKVKYIAPFISLIHSIDSEKLLVEVNKRGEENNRIINVLLQIHIADENSKFGLTLQETENLLKNINKYNYVNIQGLMGMATNTNDDNKIKTEFNKLQKFYKKYPEYFSILSIGMSGDYKIAIDSGTNMIRIGSAIFENRN